MPVWRRARSKLAPAPPVPPADPGTRLARAHKRVGGKRYLSPHQRQAENGAAGKGAQGARGLRVGRREPPHKDRQQAREQRAREDREDGSDAQVQRGLPVGPGAVLLVAVRVPVRGGGEGLFFGVVAGLLLPLMRCLSCSVRVAVLLLGVAVLLLGVRVGNRL